MAPATSSSSRMIVGKMGETGGIGAAAGRAAGAGRAPDGAGDARELRVPVVAPEQLVDLVRLAVGEREHEAVVIAVRAGGVGAAFSSVALPGMSQGLSSGVPLYMRVVAVAPGVLAGATLYGHAVVGPDGGHPAGAGLDPVGGIRVDRGRPAIDVLSGVVRGEELVAVEIGVHPGRGGAAGDGATIAARAAVATAAAVGLSSVRRRRWCRPRRFRGSRRCRRRRRLPVVASLVPPPPSVALLPPSPPESLESSAEPHPSGSAASASTPQREATSAKREGERIARSYRSLDRAALGG